MLFVIGTSCNNSEKLCLRCCVVCDSVCGSVRACTLPVTGALSPPCSLRQAAISRHLTVLTFPYSPTPVLHSYDMIQVEYGIEG